jgi:Homing endonuclease associated repeat/HNH endonuclease
MSGDRFQLTRVSGQPVSDTEILDDLKAVASKLASLTVSMPQYKQHGRYDDTTVSRRFGSWNKALVAAGLTLSNEINISDERLFENILTLWQHFGRQPRRSELAAAPSVISQSPYKRRFGSWTSALQNFTTYANAVGTEAPSVRENIETRHSTSRDPSIRLRWKVLQRDRFTCCGCGASPALQQGVELHVDHKNPWSKGGETTLENLQTLCSRCNLGKSTLV